MADMQSLQEQYEEARAEERSGALAPAIKRYRAILRKSPLHAAAYNRLMVIYRKSRDPKAEQAIIREAIARYERQAQAEQAAWAQRHRKPARISRALARQLGLLTSRGKPVYEDPQLTTWRKRLELLLRRS